MSLAITTNIAALIAQRNVSRNNSNLSSSLNKLSSGLRINSASDDASGMIIADSLKSQNLGLGQAIRNANDGVSMLQIADGALQESVDIINTIKQKSIQAASDTQTYETRTAIQNDIDKLLEEYDIISNSTSFNGQNLLTGTFTNKQIQVGASLGETVSVFISSAESTKTGHVSVSTVSPSTTGIIHLITTNNTNGKAIITNDVDIQYNNDPDNGLGAMADEINRWSEVTDIKAIAVVESESQILAGETGSDFSINEITIGNISVTDGDANYALVSAINHKSSETGVVASITSEGSLHLVSNDGRSIQIDGLKPPEIINSNQLTTIGKLKLISKGFNQFEIEREITPETITQTILDPAPNTVYTENNPDYYYSSDTGHLYQAIHEEVNWNSAKTDAEAMDFKGISGYLATVTSAAEDALINSIVPNTTSAYIGCNDVDTEDTWLWKTGPEAGLHFFTGNPGPGNGGTAEAGLYANFNVLQPNHDGDYGVYSGGWDAWDDVPAGPESGVAYYIVEYGGMPGDPVIIDGDIPTKTITTTTSDKESLEVEDQQLYCFCDIDVTTLESAQISMEIADATLECVEKIRSSIGSSQNQLESTISNLSTTQINVAASESAIRDADFAEESKVYAQMRVLTQTSTFALAQANEIQKEMLQKLLQ